MLIGFEQTTAATTGTRNGNTLQLLYRRNDSDESTIAEDADGDPLTPKVNVTRYNLQAGRFFNGERVDVDTNGVLCATTAATTPGSGTAADPFYVTVRTLAAGCGTVANSVKFIYGGANFEGNTVSCNGFEWKAPLRPCTDNFDITTLTDDQAASKDRQAAEEQHLPHRDCHDEQLDHRVVHGEQEIGETGEQYASQDAVAGIERHH
jgi:hypothetical protein